MAVRAETWTMSATGGDEVQLRSRRDMTRCREKPVASVRQRLQMLHSESGLLTSPRALDPLLFIAGARDWPGSFRICLSAEGSPSATVFSKSEVCHFQFDRQDGRDMSAPPRSLEFRRISFFSSANSQAIL